VTRGRRALAVASATAGTALLAGAFVLMVRAEAPIWAMLSWGAVALVAVATFLFRFRADRVQEALTSPCWSRSGRRSRCTRS
jgi:hypothetical protein